MAINKQDFYNALKNAVIFSPACSDKCRQLQTFRVLEQGGGAAMKAENFGATVCDKDKPFFWSRAWHNNKYKGAPTWEFPALVVIERSYTVDRPFAAMNTRKFEFNISVLDKFSVGTDKTVCTGCAGRTINEIYEDTEALLFQALSLIGKTRLYEINGEISLYTPEMVQAMQDAGMIRSITESQGWGSLQAQGVKEQGGYKAAIPQENLYGNSINLVVDMKYCDETVWNFDGIENMPVMLSQACKTCG